MNNEKETPNTENDATDQPGVGCERGLCTPPVKVEYLGYDGSWYNFKVSSGESETIIHHGPARAFNSFDGIIAHLIKHLMPTVHAHYAKLR